MGVPGNSLHAFGLLQARKSSDSHGSSCRIEGMFYSYSYLTSSIDIYFQLKSPEYLVQIATYPYWSTAQSFLRSPSIVFQFAVWVHGECEVLWNYHEFWQDFARPDHCWIQKLLWELSDLGWWWFQWDPIFCWLWVWKFACVESQDICNRSEKVGIYYW